MSELSEDQVAWLERLLFGKFAGETATKQPRQPRGGAAVSHGVDDHFNRNPASPAQPNHAGPLSAAASKRLNGLGFASPPASALHQSGPAAAKKGGWVDAPMKGATAPAAPAAKHGATPDAGQLVSDGIKDTLTDGSNPLPFDAGAMLARAVDDGTAAGGLGAKAAGAAVGGVLAAGTAVAKDADKVVSGKMTAADATADVMVEGVTGVATTLAGAEAGAMTGALFGSVVPGLGTAVGGAAGFIVGGVVGYAAGQLAHSGSALNEAKKALGATLGGVEQPLQAAWGVAAGAVHAVDGAIDAVENTAKEAAGTVAGAAESLWSSLKSVDPSVAQQAV